MKVREYSYLCSQKILKDISSDKYAESLCREVESLKDLSIKHQLIKDVDIKWQLISTALLMSEGLFKNAKTYDYIYPEVLEELENTLESIGLIAECRPLNSHNEPVYDFASLIHGIEPDQETESLTNYDDEEIETSILNSDKDYSQEEKWFDEFEALRQKEKDEAIHANDSYIIDGKLNVVGFIKMVRNALAHSSYEIIDGTNCIRLYHYNHDAKKLDMNVILNADVIIPIIDIINEIVYQKYEDFDNYASCEDFSFSDYYGYKSVSDDTLLDFILSFDICDEKIAKEILLKAKNTDLYNEPSYDYDLPGYDNGNMLKAIVGCIKEYIRPLCDYGIIINNMAYTKDNYIVSDKLYDKYSIFKYLRGHFYETTYALDTDYEYIENELRLKILSLLNALLLTMNNEVHNNNLDDVILDFGAMEIPDETLTIFNAKQLHKNNVLKEQLKAEIVKIVKDTIIIKNRIAHKEKQLKDCYRDIDYYNITLPNEIESLKNDLVIMKAASKMKGKQYLQVHRNPLDYNYEDNLAIYILNALRNSLAHGNVRFDDDYEDIGDVLITFEDYDPDNPSVLTFRGTISLCELVRTLLCEENLNILKR